MTEIEILRYELNKVDSYPFELEKADCGISGKGFFPGARGLFEPDDQTLSNKSIMILGHDFGAKRDYENSIKRGCENQQSLTWGNLNKMLVLFDIDQKQCFFTNCIMGVRVSGESALGRTIAYKYPDYLTDCKDLLIKQIAIQKPKLIIALGLNILDFLSSLSPKLSKLTKIKSFKILDDKKLAFFNEIEFVGLLNYKTNLVIITHPTYWHLNVKHRNHDGLKGLDAEKKLIKQSIY
ncbi:MAG TPA: uracil-DNA glycosylase family protein [Mucilaginibacter sp.]